MKPHTLTILSGLPGSGKSTLARREHPKALILSADDYFTHADGTYHFAAHKIAQAHHSCFRRAMSACREGMSSEKAVSIVIDNTNTTAVEIAPYVLLGESLAYRVEIVILRTSVETALARNVHGVPEVALRAMAENLGRLEASMPPWWTCRTIDAL